MLKTWSHPFKKYVLLCRWGSWVRVGSLFPVIWTPWTSPPSYRSCFFCRVFNWAKFEWDRYRFLFVNISFKNSLEALIGPEHLTPWFLDYCDQIIVLKELKRELKTSVADPGFLSRILIFTHPGFKKSKKREGWKKICHIFFATNFTKLNIILFLKCWRKNFGPISNNYWSYPKNFH